VQSAAVIAMLVLSGGRARHVMLTTRGGQLEYYIVDFHEHEAGETGEDAGTRCGRLYTPAETILHELELDAKYVWRGSAHASVLALCSPRDHAGAHPVIAIWHGAPSMVDS
jgi:hypothetical protein